MTPPIDHLSEHDWLQLVRRALAMPDAPAELLQSAFAIWQRGRPAPTEDRTPRRWLAALAFDSRASSPIAAGMRALRSDVRQLLFVAQDLDIDLRIAPQADHFALSGQVLGRPAEGSIELAGLAGAGEADAHRVTRLDGLGEFTLDGVSGGTYVLTVHLGGDEVVLAPIEIGASRAAGRT